MAAAIIRRVTHRRIVVKLGTTLLTSGRDHLDLSVMAMLVEQIAALHSRGRELIVVSSGAVAAGRERLRRRSAAGMQGTPLKQYSPPSVRATDEHL